MNFPLYEKADDKSTGPNQKYCSEETAILTMYDDIEDKDKEKDSNLKQIKEVNDNFQFQQKEKTTLPSPISFGFASQQVIMRIDPLERLFKFKFNGVNKEMAIDTCDETIKNPIGAKLKETIFSFNLDGSTSLSSLELTQLLNEDANDYNNLTKQKCDISDSNQHTYPVMSKSKKKTAALICLAKKALNEVVGLGIDCSGNSEIFQILKPVM
uniref:Condensin complex subunit 2 n=1 Tax=Rhabditophanes sp. KR3021 TaxID=114890 RepID=A0AC35TNX7_9BILA